MGCLIVLLMAVSARSALAVTWIFTDLVSRAFDGWVVPLLGLVFLPWTALLYALVYSPLKGVSLLGWVIVAIGFVADVGTLGDGGRRAKARQQSG
jgi:hypothetical protein